MNYSKTYGKLRSSTPTINVNLILQTLTLPSLSLPQYSFLHILRQNRFWILLTVFLGRITSSRHFNTGDGYDSNRNYGRGEGGRKGGCRKKNGTRKRESRIKEQNRTLDPGTDSHGSLTNFDGRLWKEDCSILGRRPRKTFGSILTLDWTNWVVEE